jgi:glycyl-tRNA synthetase beta chain
MTDFLLEIFSEEIPAKMQKEAVKNFAEIAGEILLKSGLEIEKAQIKTFVTPRRLTLYLLNLKSKQIIPAVKKVGPAVNSDPKAVEGFLRSFGLKDVGQLEQVENNGKTCYAYNKPAGEVDVVEIIKKSLAPILQKMTNAWPKLMRWDIDGEANQARWIRPIRNIACMFGEQIIDFEFAGLRANNLTFGHLSKNFEPLKINNAKDYQEILKDNFVVLDHEQRKARIIQQIRKITFDGGFETVDHEEKSALFDEVTGLCEWPTALLASIDSNFMALPEEILILTLKLNQKYFCLRSLSGSKSLAPKFIFISNALTDSFANVVRDNEKIVRARLRDAEFFISEDLKTPLKARLTELKKVVFHQSLGSVFDKTLRLNALAKPLAVFVPHSDLSLIERCSSLIKSDLVTKTVSELPELQGKIGSFYAQKQGESDEIVAAIYEHYLPLGPTSQLPQTPLGIVFAIADKIDSIVGFFLAGDKPTSSRDPYGLRRAVLGIIRISLENNIAFPIRILVERSFNVYPAKLVKKLLLNGEENFYEAKKRLVEEVIIFFVERLKFYLKENENIRPDIVNAVIEEYLSDLDAHKYCDILYLKKKIKFLHDFISNGKNTNVIMLYKRAVNILTIEEKKDGKKYQGKPHLLSLRSKHELSLYRRIKRISNYFKKLIIKGEFALAFDLLNQLEKPLSDFFDNVVVNDENADLRENRLLLLSKIRALFAKVADLSKIELTNAA